METSKKITPEQAFINEAFSSRIKLHQEFTDSIDELRSKVRKTYKEQYSQLANPINLSREIKWALPEMIYLAEEISIYEQVLRYDLKVDFSADDWYAKKNFSYLDLLKVIEARGNNLHIAYSTNLFELPVSCYVQEFYKNHFGVVKSTIEYRLERLVRFATTDFTI